MFINSYFYIAILTCELLMKQYLGYKGQLLKSTWHKVTDPEFFFIWSKVIHIYLI